MKKFILPEEITIDGIAYAVNTDFRVWIEIGDIISDKDCNPFEKAVKILKLCYSSSLPPTLEKALKGIMEFYSGKETSEKSTTSLSDVPIIDFSADFGFIASAFYHDYGIDLWEESLHWWKFRALFLGLGEENRIVKIMGYRSINICEIENKEQKKFYRKMKALYKLKDTRSESEREHDMLDKLSDIFEEVK